MKSKPTITPKRRAKALSDEALTVSADKLLNVLSKNTQEEKVYCGKCKYFYYGVWSLDGKNHCHHKSCFEKRETPVELADYRIDDYESKNANNICPDFERNEPTVKAEEPPNIDISNVEMEPNRVIRENEYLPNTPSFWDAMKGLLSWNK